MNSNVNKRGLYWWVSVLTTGTLVFWASYFGYVSQIWQNDITYITSICSAIYVAAVAMLGYVAFVKPDDYNSYETHRTLTNRSWFLSEILMGLGMVGTVIGLIHMMESGANVGVDPGQFQQTQAAISKMWDALGLALYTNLIGLVLSIALKIQTAYIGYDDES
jgi:MotA/TolQ/ExbB proton channel family